jgi:signal transduction histidine kinase
VLALTVSNQLLESNASDPTDRGHGILGMRERAALLGGSLDTRRLDGSFRVDARLPYSSPDQQ